METESNIYNIYILLENVKPILIKDYKHSYNDVSSVFFVINKPWYHPKVEFITNQNNKIFWKYNNNGILIDILLKIQYTHIALGKC